MRAFSADQHVLPLPPGHRFPAEKYVLVREALLAREVLMPAELDAAPLADRDTLLLAHTAEYVDAVFEGRLDERAQRRIGLPWSEELVQRSRASVGGTLAAARWALQHGIAGNLGGGTHHAGADHGEGYCVFNDLAVVSRLLIKEGKIRRASVVDLDVHQGNGTAAIFAGDERVFTFSMHGEKNFPFRKSASALDVNLPDGCDDGRYLAALEANLPAAFAARPELVLYQAGVDPLAEDSLGRLSLTFEGLRQRDRMVLEACHGHGVPVVLTMGGGYAKPIALTVEAHVGTYEVARALFG